MRRRTATSFLLGGGLAGTLDICYAIVFYGLRNGSAPSRILQSVASGLLGRAAYSGGAPTAVLGLCLHFLIAFIWAALYFFASRALPLLVRRAAACGIVYGVFIYANMNYLVVPLSRFPRRPNATFFPPPDILITGLLVHMLFIGLPIALAARRAFSRP